MRFQLVPARRNCGNCGRSLLEVPQPGATGVVERVQAQGPKRRYRRLAFFRRFAGVQAVPSPFRSGRPLVGFEKGTSMLLRSFFEALLLIGTADMKKLKK